MKDRQQHNIECCPEFNPAPWDNATFEWNNKQFIKGKVTTVFYMPINFGRIIIKLNELIGKAGAQVPDRLCLSDHVSKWKMDLFLAVDREVPGVENVVLSGKYLSKVYEGNYRETGKWCRDFEAFVKEKGFNIQKMYMWYTTCPKCAKKHGKNYVVIMARVA